MWRPAVAFVVALAALPPVAAQELRAVERTIESLPKSCWFLVPPRDSSAGKPGRKAGLVVVLPGGDGSREYRPWVENGLLAQAPADCVGVLVTAVQWTAEQKVVWPVAPGDAKDMQYTTSQYVRAVVAAVEQEFAIDPARRVVVAWSSSGMAVQPLLAEPDAPFARAYVAMSSWPRGLDLKAVKGKRYLLDHSPDDQQTAFSHCRRAYAELTKAGAVVRVSVYTGGHGWQGDSAARLRDGFQWLFGKEPPGKPAWPPAPKPGANLLRNAGFEDDLTSWNEVANTAGFTAAVVADEKRSGKHALHLQKTGAEALDLLRQEAELPAGGRVVGKLWAKSKGSSSAFVNVLLYDENDQLVHEDGRLAALSAAGGWKEYERDWPAKGAVRAIVQIVMLEGGELWVDDVMLTVVK